MQNPCVMDDTVFEKAIAFCHLGMNRVLIVMSIYYEHLSCFCEALVIYRLLFHAISNTKQELLFH